MYRLLLIPVALLFLLLAFAQSDRLPQQQRALYREASQWYSRALQVTGPDKDRQEEGLNRKALELFHQFLRGYGEEPPDSLLFFAAAKTGELEHYFDHPDSALAYYNKAIRYKKAVPQLQDSVVFKPYIFAALIYYRQNNLDSALAYLGRAEKILDQSHRSLPESERLYNSLGSIHYEYGNYKQAINYFRKALDNLSPHNPAQTSLRTNYQINLATAFFKLESYIEAEAMFKALLQSGIYTGPIYNNLGLIAYYRGRYEEALHYFRRVPYSNELAIGLNNDIARTFLQLQAYDSARKYIGLAKAQNNTYPTGGTSVDFGNTLMQEGALAVVEKDYRKALTCYQQSMHQFYPAFDQAAWQQNPLRFTGSFSYINLFHALVAKAACCHLLYGQTGEPSWAQHELATWQSAFALLQYVEQTYESDEARLFLERSKYQVHHKPIAIAYELYQQTRDQRFLEQAYYFDQLNKASVLLLRTHTQEALRQKAPELFGRLHDLKARITRLALRVATTKDSLQKQTDSRQIADLEIQLGKLQPRITALGIQPGIPSSQALRTGFLDPHTVLLSFHISDSAVYSIILSQKSFSCIRQPITAQFHNDLSRFLQAVKEGNDAGDAGARLYAVLLGKVALEGFSRLIIIPDDELSYLPFEALKDPSGRYLVEHYAVQYQYSTAFLKQQRTGLEGHTTLAMAPFAKTAFSNDSLALEPLPASAEEVTNNQGRTFLDTAATKKQFLDNLASYDILHLATHAVVNEKENGLSFIAFYPAQKGDPSSYLLYEKEIYDLPLQNTKLVILSACETGSGNLVRGEGIISLSRAFTYAGCSNTITSLWNAADLSTAMLTQGLHAYLQRGLPLDEALRKAKLDYLHDPHIHPRLRQPRYWAHLIFIGDYEVEKRSSFQGVLIVCILLFIGLVVLWRSRIKRSRA